MKCSIHVMPHNASRLHSPSPGIDRTRVTFFDKAMMTYYFSIKSLPDLSYDDTGRRPRINIATLHLHCCSICRTVLPVSLIYGDSENIRVRFIIRRRCFLLLARPAAICYISIFRIARALSYDSGKITAKCLTAT